MTLRCPECRSRRASFDTLFKHVVLTGHRLCLCGGYHYPHRPGSPYCERNPMSPALHASRAGSSDEEVLEIVADIAFTTLGKRGSPKHPPF